MDSAPVFVGLLQRAGFTAQRQRQAIVQNGFTTCEDLSYASSTDVNTMFEIILRANRNLPAAQQVRLTVMHKRSLNALRREFIMRRNCASAYGEDQLNALDAAAIDDLAIKHDDWESTVKAASSTSPPDVTVPKLTKTNWRLFKRAFFQLVDRQRGLNSIPLSYVARPNLVNDYDRADPYESTQALLMSCITLTGNKYIGDNHAFFSILQQHTTGTEVEAFVTRYESTKNGRAAWTAILAHTETQTYRDNIRSAAMKVLSTAHYNGEKRDFGISDYYELHANAHNDLIEAGTPLAEVMKIDSFVNRLKDEQALNWAITARNLPGIVTFQEFYNEFYARVSQFRTVTTSSQAGIRRNNDRSVNAVQQQGRGGCGGRGRGRGRGSYRGGRGRGRGGRGGRGHQPFRPRAGHYQEDEWLSLSSDQRQQVVNLRAALRNIQQQQNGNPQGDQQQRFVQQMNAGIPPPPPPPPPPPAGDASVPGSIYAPATGGGASVGGQSMRSNQGRAGDAFAPGRRGSN